MFLKKIRTIEKWNIYFEFNKYEELLLMQMRRDELNSRMLQRKKGASKNLQFCMQFLVRLDRK